MTKTYDARATASFFYYSTGGHGFCVRCIHGEDHDVAPPEYTRVPDSDLDLVICEECGAHWEGVE